MREDQITKLQELRLRNLLNSTKLELRLPHYKTQQKKQLDSLLISNNEYLLLDLPICTVYYVLVIIPPGRTT